MRSHRVSLAPSLLVMVALFTQTACPLEEDASPATGAGIGSGGLDELDFALSVQKGLICLSWFKYRNFIDPHFIAFSLPPGTSVLFSGEVGRYSFDSDFDGIYEYSTPISGTGSEAIFPICPGGPSASISADTPGAIVISNPFGGQTVGPGAFGLVLNPGVVFLPPPGCYTVPIELLEDQATGPPIRVVRNKALLVRTQILPHLPFGVAGMFSVTSRIVLNNPHNREIDVDLQFFDALGNPLPVTANGMTSATRRVRVGPRSSVQVDLTSSLTAVPAWAKVIYPQELMGEASSVFITEEIRSAMDAKSRGGSQIGQGAAQLPAGEAGVASGPTALFHTLAVNRGGGLETALAMVNPTTVTAQIRYLLRSETDSFSAEAEGMLRGLGQQAVFVFQLFPQGSIPENFRGTLEIRSDTDLSVISLNTINGFQTSSLPSGTVN